MQQRRRKSNSNSDRAAPKYWPVLRPTGQLRAPGVISHTLQSGEDFVLIFAPGDELMSGLEQFARQHHIRDAHFTAIGAASRALIGWYDAKRHAYKTHRVDQQCEVTSLIGNIVEFNDKPTLHAHVNLGLEDGSVVGGHVLGLFVWPTLELFLHTSSTPLKKSINSHTGLPTII